MIRARRPVAGLLLAGALLATSGCASSVDPIERLGRRAAERVMPAHGQAPAPDPAPWGGRRVVVQVPRGPGAVVREPDAAGVGRVVPGNTGVRAHTARKVGGGVGDGDGASVTGTAARMFRSVARSWPHPGPSRGPRPRPHTCPRSRLRSRNQMVRHTVSRSGAESPHRTELALRLTEC